VLIASERVRYEKTVGQIPSPNQFLQLLISDPWFAWLRPLSQLIVAMDEALDGKEPLTVAEVDALVGQSDRLIAPLEDGEGFGRQYFEALQRDPDAVLAHAEVTRLRGGAAGCGGRRTTVQARMHSNGPGPERTCSGSPWKLS
jgi:hypothetical protein